MEIAALAPTELVEMLPKCRNARTCVRVVLGGRHQHANPPHPFRLLRVHRKRPVSESATERGQELPPPNVDSHLPHSLGHARCVVGRIFLHYTNPQLAQ
jgi:hypothetical protein